MECLLWHMWRNWRLCDLFGIFSWYHLLSSIKSPRNDGQMRLIVSSYFDAKTTASFYKLANGCFKFRWQRSTNFDRLIYWDVGRRSVRLFFYIFNSSHCLFFGRVTILSSIANLAPFIVYLVNISLSSNRTKNWEKKLRKLPKISSDWLDIRKERETEKNI